MGYVKELNRIVVVEFAVEVTDVNGSVTVIPCSAEKVEEEAARLSAPPLLGEPLKTRILTRTKVTVINATTWVAAE